MKLIVISIAVMTLAINFAFAGEHAEKIGKAVVVQNSVDLITDQGAYVIVVGTDIRTRQTVTTGVNSSSQFTMSDDTRLAVGPNSQLFLDEFVYDPDPSKRKVVLRTLKGALRFVTGKNPSNTYTINTPTAVIGVRGTMFDIYINGEGKTIVGLLKGKVNVCPPGSPKCQDLQTPGRFLSIDRQGRIRKADRPDRAMLGRVAFARAFPFLGSNNRLRGKLAAPQKLRQRIRKKAGLRSLPRNKIKKKAVRRKIIKRKVTRKQPQGTPPKRRHKRARSNAQGAGGFRPPARHRKVISQYDNEDASVRPRHRKSLSRRQQGGGGYRPPVHRKATSRYRPGGVKRPPAHRKSTSRYQTGNGKLRPRHRKSLSARQKNPKHKKSRSKYQGGIIFRLPGGVSPRRNGGSTVQ